ncbi:MAG: thioredoxin family protein [Bdellovibrionota bacterium]|nr:thioredoxin family protein [Bdellovibrionota bacterium]
MGQLSIMKHNAVYSSGILFSFLVLSFIVLILKSSGEQIGWGFHLQSASFLSIMILFLFILSLNLFGLYEIRTPGGKVIGNIDIDNSYKSDFISGVLATILSTPCSAPFLGVALTFAFTSSFPVTLLIFLSVGLGLSLPFLFVGIFPAMLKVLPKPGTWMEHFKKFLGLSLLLTSLWLFDVFQTIIPTPMSSTILILTLILTFFTFYSLKHMKLNKLGSLILIIIPFLSLFYLVGIQLDTKDINASSRVVQKATNHPSKWEVWAPEKMSYYKKEGQAVFVDFTAKWCFTCIVNEKLVLQTKEFEKLMQDKGIKPLIADWTKRDPIIGNWLKQQGVFGLPAYFIQTSKGKLIHLGETISIKEIKKHL